MKSRRSNDPRNFGMKLLVSFMLMGSVMFTDFSVTEALADRQAKEVAVAISDAYVPSNFFRNSDVIVIASGVFPNGCYRWSRAQVKHLDPFLHEVTAYAKVQQGLCLMVLVPFNKDVSLGLLDPGQHKVRFLAGEGEYFEKSFSVE